MKHRTPFLPGLSHLLNGRRPRCEQDRLREQAERLRQAFLSRLCHIFGRWLPADLFASPPGSRDRSYPLSLTFWAFLSQVLNPGSPCREIVRKVRLWHRRRQRPIVWVSP